jgi:hypothetical protein
VRNVQVIEPSGDVTRAHHVIGADESGNVTGPGPFCLAAVRCPRENGELIAELLIQNGLNPWLTKSQSLKANVSREEYNRRVEAFIDDLEESDARWQAAFGYDDATIHHKGAGVCALAKGTITSDSTYSGDAVLLPDGATTMYGEQQQHLRRQVSQFFDGSFESTFGAVYTSGLAKADLTYPEVTAADYISGYLRDALHHQEMSVSELPSQVSWFDSNWREPANLSAAQFYALKPAAGHYGPTEATRIAAWVKGRHPDGDDHDVSSQIENTVDMLESEEVQTYLRENVLS